MLELAEDDILTDRRTVKMDVSKKLYKLML